VELFPAHDGTVYVLRPGEPDLALKRLDRDARRVLGSLTATPVAVSDLGPGAAAVLTRLEAVGVVMPADPDAPPVPPRHARQEPYLAALGVTQRQLRDVTVAVLGCGGLGTWTVASLAALGVGRLVLVDDDTVEPGNLNRQILYAPGDVGALKVSCAARWLHAFDPAIAVVAHPARVTSVDEVDAVLDGVDVLVQAADTPPYTLNRWVNAACIARRVPYITAGQVPPLLRIGPFYVPGRTACFACHEHHLRASAPLYDELVAHRQSHADDPAVTLGTASGLIGSTVASEVLHLLSDPDAVATAGRALLLDLRTLEQRWEAIPRDPGCPACHHLGDGRGTTTADLDARPRAGAPDAPARPADRQ
jgi:bacteriocin biosynthesis cyclodehydratase domain-containing protein